MHHPKTQVKGYFCNSQGCPQSFFAIHRMRPVLHIVTHRTGPGHSLADAEQVFVQWPVVGFNNPAMPWSELHRPPHRPGPAAGTRRVPEHADGGDSPAWSRTRQPFEPRRARAPARRGALRRAALPLELQLPRRRQPPRGARRGGRPARPRGPRPHRPRRLLRRRPLRRGGPGRRRPHHLRRRAEPRAHRPPERRRRPRGQPRPRPRPRPRGLRPPRPHHLHRPPPGRREGQARLRPRRAGRRPRRPLARAHRLPQGDRPRRPRRRRARPPPPGRWPTSSPCSATATSPSSCGTTATRSTRPATTPSPSSPPASGLDVVATNNVHYATPAQRPPRHRPRRRAGPPQPRRDRRLAAGLQRRPPPQRRRAGPPLPPLPRRRRAGRRASASSCAFDLRLVAPEPAAVPVPRRAHRDAVPPPPRRGGRHRAATAPAGAERVPGAWRPDRPRAGPHRGPRLPRLLPRRVGHRRVLPRRRHLLPGAGERRQLGGLLRPRGHQRRRRAASACCSSASSRPSATARPTSTSTSSRAGGRRPSSTSTPSTAASTPPRWPTSSPTGPSRRSATWPRRSATPPASRTPGRKQADPWGPLRATAERRPDHEIPAAVLDLALQVEHFPRHLGIHSGGMVICDRPVIEVCPVEWARFTGRDGAASTAPSPSARCCSGTRTTAPRSGLVKFDLLGLGMLTALHARRRPRARPPTATRSTWPPSRQDDAVYDMLCRADSVGVFQVESRAQMATLPRLQAPLLLRPRRRDRPHPPRPHPGRLGAPLHPAPQRRRAGHLPPPPHRGGAGQDPRRAAVPGAAHAARHRRRRVHRGGVRPAPPGHGVQAQPGADGAAAPALPRGRRRPRRRRRDHRGALGEARRLRQLRLPREPLGVLRLPRLLVVVAEAVVPGGVLRRAAQRPADGLLLAALARAGRPPPRRRGPHAPTSTPRRASATLETDTGPGRWRRPRTTPPGAVGRGRPGGAPRHRLGAGHRRRARPRRSPPVGPTPRWRTCAAGCPTLTLAHLEALATAGAFERCFGLDRREALWQAGAVAQSTPGRLAGIVTGAEAPALPGMDAREEAVADLWATGVAARGPPHAVLREPSSTSSGVRDRRRRCKDGRRRREGARRRGRHPPPAPGHRPGHHVRQPRGRDRLRQRRRVEGVLGPLPPGRTAGHRRCSCGARSSARAR